MKSRPEILFQNDSIVAIDKPSGLLSVPDRYHEEKPSLSAILDKEFAYIKPLHRLDFETSGIMLFCIMQEAFGWYSDQFEQRTISKEYQAITEGRCYENGGLIDKPLFTQHTGKVIIDKKGKSSQTEWKVLERFINHTLVEVHPLTGRTHQVRVHLASVGHPIVNDLVYGSTGPLFLSSLKGKNKYRLSKDAEEERPLLSRIALHASRVRFMDFVTREIIQIESPLPKDIRVSLIKLRQFSSLDQ